MGGGRATVTKRGPGVRTPPPRVLPVAGFVASAGGLAAFKSFFGAMPADSGIAFVVVSHLDPIQERQLVPLLGKCTAMRVLEAARGQTLKANHVCVSPPGWYLTLQGGTVTLSRPKKVTAWEAAIDPFLESLAEDRRERAVCIVLSGSGSLGSLGVKAVKAAGGMVMVQDPSTAEFNRMPQSAVDTGLADYVLTPERMPEELLKYVRHLPAGVAVPPDPEAAQDGPKQVEQEMGKVTAERERRLAARTADLEAEVQERRRAETQLRELVEQAPDGYFVADLEGRYQDVNAAGCRMLGYSREEILEKRITDLIPPEDEDRLWQVRDEMLKDGKTQAGEWALRRKDGTTVPVEVNARIMTDGRWQALVRDITRRRQLQAEVASRSDQLRAERNFINAVLENQATLVVVLDNELRTIRFNRACERVSGYRFVEMRDTAAWQKLIPAEEQEGVQAVARALQAGETFVRHENHWRCRDGTLRLISWNNTVLKDDHGRVQYLVGIGVDITEQRQAQEAADRRLEELDHLHRLRTAGELATLLAHELNQPLAAINSYSEASLRLVDAKRIDRERLTQNLTNISEQALRAGRTVKNLRSFFSRPAKGVQAVDLNDIARNAAGLIEPQAREERVAIKLDLADLPLNVLASEVQLEHVIINLVRNAIEGIARGPTTAERTVTVVTRTGDGSALITVRDTGPGVSAEDASKIFDPFYTTKPDGLGMGLRISRSIVESLQGRLWVEPRQPGAVFRFAIPLAP